MESEEGLWEGPVQLGPSTRWDEGLHLASIFPPPPISTLPLPSLSLCAPWETRPEMAPRKTTYSLKALFGFPPKQEREEAHLPSFVRCSPLDQSTGPRGRDLPDQRGSCPIKAAYAGGRSCFQKRMPGSTTPVTLDRTASAHTGLETPLSGDRKLLCLPCADSFFLPFMLPSFRNFPRSSPCGKQTYI